MHKVYSWGIWTEGVEVVGLAVGTGPYRMCVKPHVIICKCHDSGRAYLCKLMEVLKLLQVDSA